MIDLTQFEGHTGKGWSVRTAYNKGVFLRTGPSALEELDLTNISTPNVLLLCLAPKLLAEVKALRARVAELTPRVTFARAVNPWKPEQTREQWEAHFAPADIVGYGDTMIDAAEDMAWLMRNHVRALAAEKIEEISGVLMSTKEVKP